MGYHELDELGEKIQDIIDSAINEKNYQKLNQTINQTVNKAIDNGSEALRDALNNTFGGNSGKYTITAPEALTITDRTVPGIFRRTRRAQARKNVQKHGITHREIQAAARSRNFLPYTCQLTALR